MSKYYIEFNDDGSIKTRYIDSVPGGKITPLIVECTTDQWTQSINPPTGKEIRLLPDKTIGLVDIKIIPPTPEQIALAVEFARQRAYTQESDPLFFKYQRGTATKEEWIAKVDEIKARYPDGVMPK